MYSKEINGWKPECADPRDIERYREKQKEDVDARFYLADNMIAKSSSGKETASAVWMMEEVAKENHVLAVFSMGQLFHYGWAVKQDNATAEFWYKKAVELGCAEAETALKELKENKKPAKKADTTSKVEKIPEPVVPETPATEEKVEKKSNKKIGIIVCIALIIAVAVVAGVIDINNSKKGNGNGTDIVAPQKELVIKVDDDTALTQTGTVEESAIEQAKLREKFDDDDVVSGKKPTNRLIVEFEGDELDLSGFKAVSVVARNGGIIVIQFDSAQEAQRCREALEKMPGIVYVKEDGYQQMGSHVFNTSTSDSNVYSSSTSGQNYHSWGVEDLELDVFADYLAKNNKSTEIIVAVIDTGVEPNPITEKRILKGIDMVNSNNQYGHVDQNGHGTHVSGTVFDATQGLDVKILPIGVCVGGDSLSDMGILSGIDYACENGASVINMSLGGLSDGSDKAYRRVITRALNQGVVVVVSAGNESSDTRYYCPAAIDDCIVVAAHDPKHRTASFSNFGSSVDVSAPGTEIYSFCSSHHPYSVEVKPDVYMAYLQGTSMAAPHIAALAAMLKLYVPNATPQQVEKYIKDYCENPGDELHYGAGICKAGLFIEK